MRIGTDVVLDASGYLRSTQGNVAAIEVMRAYAYGQVRFHAPAHFFVEVANVLRKSVNAGRETKDDARLTLNAALRLRIEVVDDPYVAADAFEFSLERGTSVYDEAYVIVSLRRKASLITADAGLAQAARAAIVDTILVDEAEA